MRPVGEIWSFFSQGESEGLASLFIVREMRRIERDVAFETSMTRLEEWHAGLPQAL
jgi:hypothetical protein